MVQYIIALALFMRFSYRAVLSRVLVGVHWLLDPSAGVNLASESGLSQARIRIGRELRE